MGVMRGRKGDVQRIHAFTRNCVEGTHIGDLRLGGIVADELCLVGQPYSKRSTTLELAMVTKLSMI